MTNKTDIHQTGKNRYTTLLRTQGLKATPQRLHVLRLLSGMKRPVSIAELQKKGNMDSVTLYRSLETLTKKSLVRPVDLRHGHTDYEFVNEGKHHHHLVCERCGAIEDFEWCPDPDLKKKVLKKASSFAKVTDHSLEFFGICKKCV